MKNLKIGLIKIMDLKNIKTFVNNIKYFVNKLSYLEISHLLNEKKKYLFIKIFDINLPYRKNKVFDFIFYTKKAFINF